jgi:hypothetical protein
MTSEELKMFNAQWYEEEKTGCWIWTGRKLGGGKHRKKAEYGIMPVKVDGEIFAYRVSYEHFVGPIPHAHVIDHGGLNKLGVPCDNPPCVNWEHLLAVTQQRNVTRNPNNLAAINAAKVACPRGHEYTPENTLMTKKKERVCKACQKTRDETYRKAYNEMKKARRHELKEAKRVESISST